MRIHSLFVYPVKGARGIALERAEVLRTGLRHDRRFMVVDGDGRFMSQRAAPTMAQVEVAFDGDQMMLRRDGQEVTVPLDPDALDLGTRRQVGLLGDKLDVADVLGDGGRFFSEVLGRRCALVAMPSDAVRRVENTTDDHVLLADGFPILVASLASLAELNGRLAQANATPVPMSRFRANVVVEGGEPYAEERSGSGRARLGDLGIRLPKRCSRCQVVTVDQVTGVVGKEPLKTLASYRTDANKVYFAMNAIPDLAASEVGVLRIGDPVVYDP